MMFLIVSACCCYIIFKYFYMSKEFAHFHLCPFWKYFVNPLEEKLDVTFTQRQQTYNRKTQTQAVQ